MQWYTIFLAGLLAGIGFFLVVSGNPGAATVQAPVFYWDLDGVKYVISLFVATVLAIAFLWY